MALARLPQLKADLTNFKGWLLLEDRFCWAADAEIGCSADLVCRFCGRSGKLVPLDPWGPTRMAPYSADREAPACEVVRVNVGKRLQRPLSWGRVGWRSRLGPAGAGSVLAAAIAGESARDALAWTC